MRSSKSVFIIGLNCVLIGPFLRGQTASVVVDHTFGEFLNAVSLSVNAAGQVYVLDAGKNELSQFSPKGDAVKTIGGRGWGDLEFDSPTDVSANFALDVYVADYNNRRVQRFDKGMNFVQSITADNIVPTLSGSFYPRAAALSAQGELFVVESDGRRILKFDPAQHLVQEFGSFNAGAGALVAPIDILVTPDGKVFVLDDKRIVEYDTYANYVASIALDSLQNPLSLNLGPHGLLVSTPNAIRGYSYDGVRQFDITHQGLIGSESDDEFRDAVMIGSALYILTAHAVTVVKFVRQ